jgi:deoxyadenosine/deoxycytidine kinase
MATSPILITLDGNIGAGKSTLLEAIRTNIPNVSVIQEPVGDWLTMKNADGESLLSLFYKDTARWSYTFQNVALLTRLMHTNELLASWTPDKPSVIVTERSVLTDRYVFAEMLHRQGKIDELEWTIYNKWFNYYAKDIPVKGIIHLATSASTSKERIGIRGRTGEEGIPLSYLADLDDQHNAWIAESHLPTLQISTEPGFAIEKTLNQIRDWLSANFPSHFNQA